MVSTQPRALFDSIATIIDQLAQRKRVIWYFYLINLILVFLIVYPRAVYIRLYPQDVFGFLDGIHRTVSGQVPNRDFSTPFGAMFYALPALFVRFGANPLLSLSYAQAALLVLNLFAVSHLLRTRLGGMPGLLFASWTSLLLAARMNLGEPMHLVTFAMNYNRYCTVFLSEILIFFILPKGNDRPTAIIDVAIIALLSLILFYTKMTYFVVAAAALGLLLLTSWANAVRVGAALAVFLIIVAAIELAWGLLPGYLAALFAAAHTSGVIRSPIKGVLYLIQLNLPELVVCLLLPIIVLYELRVLSPWNFLTFAFVAVASLLLLDQNAQMQVLAVPFTLLFIAIDIIVRRTRGDAPRRTAKGLLVGAIIVMFSWYSYPLVLNIAVSFAKSISDIRPTGNEQITKRLLIDWDQPDGTLLPDMVKGNISPFDVFARARESATNVKGMWLSVAEYAISIEDGAAAVRAYCGSDPRVLIADKMNPFPALLDLQPVGKILMFSAERTIPVENHPPPQQIFADATCIMAPKLPIDYLDRQLFFALYGGYVKNNFKPSGETDYWIVYRRTGGHERTLGVTGSR
jgi:hypothetical protein